MHGSPDAERSQSRSRSQSRPRSVSPHRRTARACDQCRRRKQRCDGASVPCQRCARVGKTCSFETEASASPRTAAHDARWGSGQALVLQRMQDEIASLRESIAQTTKRIEHLESGQQRRDKPGSTDVGAVPELDLTTLTTEHTLNHGSFDKAPIQTLRGLLSVSATGQPVSLDPVASGILSIAESQQLFDIFFHACHELAPCSSLGQTNAQTTRTRSPFLFTCICLIGARYWEMDHPIRSQQNWLHPRYADLLGVFDNHIRDLVVRPTSSDFVLESIQGLLLATQWPPLDLDNGKPKSRFNDAYAWLMIGLAIRLAQYIDLEKCVDSNLETDEDMQRMRVWLNLVSVDRHLTVTAGLPATLTAPHSKILRTFGSHPKAQSGDLKLAGLGELVLIVQRASLSCGDVSLRQLDAISLNVVTAEMDAWDKAWSVVLHQSPTFRQQMPFTALRWYRLALNAIPIGSELGEAKPVGSASPAALAAGVQAAFQLLWQYSSEACSERPERVARGTGYSMNFSALSSFMFAVDSYWITHAFAAVFLVLVYDRGCIDVELNALPFIGTAQPVPQESTLYRIISFAVAIFDGICQGATHHPAGQYRSIVANALQTLKGYRHEESTGNNDMLASIFDLGQDWTFLRDLGM